MKRPAPREGVTWRVRYGERVARKICERIAAGESWWSMAGRGGMPAHATLFLWRDRYPVFAEALAQAREVAREKKLNPGVAMAPPQSLTGSTPST